MPAKRAQRLADFHKLVALLQRLPFQDSAVDVLRRPVAIKRVIDGERPEVVARDTQVSKAWLETKAESVKRQGLAGFLPGARQALASADLDARRLGIAQMLLGTLAEKRFEELSAEITGGRHLYIEDHVRTRTDTDYLLRNGHSNPVCRMNIKFHGTLFRKAREMVGLEPEDCFALATYKISNALRKQEQEALPYVFLVLSIRDLSASSVAAHVPNDLVWLICVMEGKRIIEEAIVRELAKPEYEDQFRGILNRMTEGEFRLLSARKAFTLLQAKLFDRVFALKVKRFNQSYKNAEIDMHFSISLELTPLRAFLEILARDSLHVLNVRLDRGEI